MIKNFEKNVGWPIGIFYFNKKQETIDISKIESNEANKFNIPSITTNVTEDGIYIMNSSNNKNDYILVNNMNSLYYDLDVEMKDKLLIINSKSKKLNEDSIEIYKIHNDIKEIEEIKLMINNKEESIRGIFVLE